mgnify:CR=1 FL=1
MIAITNLSKIYQIGDETVHALDHASLHVSEGEFVSIIGPSGSGKSTFLRCLNLLEMPTAGSVVFEGTDITDPHVNINKHRQRMGMVFVKPVLFSHLNIIENVMIGMMDLKGMNKENAYEKARTLLAKVGIADKAEAYPEQLSAGKKQLATIARAFSLDPEVLLLDEPTTNVDPIMKGGVETLIKDYAKLGNTVVIVSHEKELLNSVCDRIIYMKAGRIIEEGPKEKMINCPEHAEVKEFLELLLTS